MSIRHKVVHLIPTLERGGSEMSQLRMLPLLGKDVEHVFVTLRQSGSLSPQFEERGLRVFSLHQSHLLDIRSYIKLIELLNKLAPDLIVSHLLVADLVGRFIVQPFVPYRVVSSLATTYNFPRYWYARLIERFTRYFCQGYIANAHIVKETYVRKFHVPEQKITVLTTGMDTSLFRSLIPDAQLRQEIGIQPTDIVFICVANLHINKGHRYLLEAFEQLFQKNQNIKLLLVGDGDERSSLEQQREQYLSHASIEFLGKRPDVPKLLKLAHVFVLPTFFEGMCNAIMEAMASGLPVVTTNIPENRELVTHNETGLLCEVGDTTSLTQALDTLLHDSEARERLGRSAARSIEERYELHATANRWRQYFLTTTQS